MSGAWSNVASGAVGGLIGVSGALLGKRWDDRRAFRREKGERLRALFAPIAQAAVTLQSLVAEKDVLLGGETPEQRDNRHRKEAEQAEQAVRFVGGLVVVEPGMEDVSGTYAALYRNFAEYRAADHNFRLGRPDRRKEPADQIDRLASELQQACRARLSELEAPPSRFQRRRPRGR